MHILYCAVLLLPRSLDTWNLSSTYCALSPLPGEHSSQCCHSRRTHANHTHKPTHPTGYPFIHLGGEQQRGLNALLKDISARRRNRTHDPLIESRATDHYTITPPHCVDLNPSLSMNLRTNGLWVFIKHANSCHVNMRIASAISRDLPSK